MTRPRHPPLPLPPCAGRPSPGDLCKVPRDCSPSGQTHRAGELAAHPPRHAPLAKTRLLFSPSQIAWNSFPSGKPGKEGKLAFVCLLLHNWLDGCRSTGMGVAGPAVPFPSSPISLTLGGIELPFPISDWFQIPWPQPVTPENLASALPKRKFGHGWDFLSTSPTQNKD